MKHILHLLILPLLIISCVSNKEVTYLQYKNELKQNSVTPNTVARTYPLNSENKYTFQADDRIEIKIASTTSPEYNPFSISDPQFTSTVTNGSSNDITKGYTVKHNGTIDLPLFGEMMVKGLTLENLEDSITTRAQAYLKDPVVKVGLLNFKFTVISEDMNKLILSDSRNLSVFQALSLASMHGQYVDLSKVKLIRHIDGQAQVVYLNLLDETLIQSPYYYIHPNDIIVLSPVNQRTYLKYFGQNISQIAAVVTTLISILTLSITLSK